MTLKERLHQVEQQVGTFSRYNTTAGAGENIPFVLKPAQQFLHGLGVELQPDAPLSRKKDGILHETANDDVVIKGFESHTSPIQLTITGKRIDRLLQSAKIYVNTDIFPKDLYAKALESKTIVAQDKSISVETQLHRQNLAVGVCHVQEIDLLTSQSIVHGQAINASKGGRISEDEPALLLLSSPALNYSYGTANHLSHEQQRAFITGMFRNLFEATLKEGRQYIAMPAAGLGVFGGDPSLYFEILMKVAREFPRLNIIYHPAQFTTLFDEKLQEARVKNVIRANKDVLFIANELTQQGLPCAFHNPSDCDVVYGVYDVGEYWKNGRGAGYVGEEHIGAMTTAPLNSRGLNFRAYTNIIEQGFLKKVTQTEDKDVQLIDTIINRFDEKIASLTHPNAEAFQAADELSNTLWKIREDYAQTKSKNPREAAEVFVTQAKLAISKVTPVLERDLGWGDYLVNMMKNLINSVIYLATAGYNNRLFSPKKPESVIAAQELEQAIDNTIGPHGK